MRSDVISLIRILFQGAGVEEEVGGEDEKDVYLQKCKSLNILPRSALVTRRRADGSPPPWLDGGDPRPSTTDGAVALFLSRAFSLARSLSLSVSLSLLRMCASRSARA